MTTVASITLSEDQERALDRLVDWCEQPYHGPDRSYDMRDDLTEFCVELSMGGLAGTGKTTLIGQLLDLVNVAAVLAPTGKAARVLQKKSVPARTIHSALYRCIGEKARADGTVEPIFEEAESPIMPGELVIVDEASMVNAQLARDMRAKGWRILWVGDHGQLEPVGEDPGIMKNPDIRLEKVHRQALDSPITRLAHAVRVGESFSTDSDLVTILPKRRTNVPGYCLQEEVDQLLVGFNRDRHAMNKWMRGALGHNDDAVLEPEERVICLLNDKGYHVWNGVTYDVLDVAQDPHRLHVLRTTVMDDMDQMLARLPFWAEGFAGEKPASERPNRTCYFDYGYAITTHKSQGSEWEHVAVYDSPCRNWDMPRWRYTAVTRARSRLTVFT